VVDLLPLGFTVSVLTSASRLWMLYIRPKIDIHVKLSLVMIAFANEPNLE